MHLAAKLAAFLARGADTVGACSTCALIALKDMAIGAVFVNGFVTAELALDSIAAALGGDAGTLGKELDYCSWGR